MKKKSLFALTLTLGLLPDFLSAQVVISEIMYNPIGGNTNEFVELHNVGGSAVDVGGWSFTAGISYTFASPSVMGPDAYLVVAVNRTAFALLYPDVTNLAAGVYSGQLSNQGELLTLANASGATVFSVTYDDAAPWPTAAAGLGSSLVLVDPFSSPNNSSNWVASVQLNGSPGGPDTFFVRDVVINEVLAHTDPPQEDAVELRNLTTNAVGIAGWYLSDDNVVRKKYRFPAGTTIPPNGYLTVYQYQMTNGLIPFALSANGDDIYLSEADSSDKLVRYVDQYQYGASQNGVSFGRCPDGTGEFMTLSTPTFGVSAPASVEEFRAGTGARNAGPKVGPIVINEIMYHPADTNALGQMPVEYVELLNISDAPVPFYHAQYPTNTWSLTGGISYDFPTNLTMQPGQFLLIVATNAIAEFRQSYGLSTNLVVLGPWSKALNNSGDTVRLRAPNSPDPVDGTVARYVVDEVTYKDSLPWPLAADGLGGSLERTDSLAYGNAADNWHSLPGTATPGTTNSAYVPPGSILISEIMAVNRSTLQDEDGDYSDWIELCNVTAHAVSLKGWHLTDSADAPAAWTFPDVSIPALGQLIVFASKKDRTDPAGALHANFSLDAGGEYLALFRDDLTLECAFDPAYPAQSADVSYGYASTGTRTEKPVQFGSGGRYLVPTASAQLATNWFEQTFDDSAWKTAGNGVGYDTAADYRPYIQTDLYSEMYGKQGSVFVRYPFVLSDSAHVEQMVLRLKFEDGVAVWLNGTRVLTNNTPATLAWNSANSPNRDDSLALQYQDFGLSGFVNLLADGTNVLALQLINTSTTSSDLLLVSDLQLTWAPPTGTVSRALGFLASATPGSANDSTLPGVVSAPALSPFGGLFADTLSVTVTCATAGAAIHYTLDGSEPTTNSPVYSAPLTFSQETELIVRAFVPGQVPSPTTGAVFRRSFLGVNELLADNVASTPEIADFTDFGDWFELYNGGTNAVDLSGYYLSDNLDSPFRWRIPNGATIAAKGYLLFWADGYDSKPGLTLTRDFWPNASFTTRYYHTNFKLSAAGEAVGLFSPHGSRVDTVTYGPDLSNHWYWEKATDWQQEDISYGRYPDGGAQWGFFGEPTAGTTNRPPQLSHNLYRAPKVTISPAEPLFVDAPITVSLASDAGVNAIRYTLDGSQPTSASLLYTNAFVVATTTVVRARAYAEGLHPGMVATRTFLMNQHASDLPVLSIVIDPKLLYDSVTGIFANSLKEREVPGTLQLCTSPSNTAFQIDAGLRLFSYNTFLGAQKPFTVYLDTKYNNTAELGYQLFPEKPIGAFDRFVLRNGNDDWAEAYFRDSLCAKIMEGRIVNALQAYRPTASYLNGKYYGLIDIREKVDEMMVVKNEGVPLEYVDFYENNGVDANAEPILDAGTDEAWLALNAFLDANNLSLAANYDYVRSQVDVENLMDYVIADSFVNDIAWGHNRKWWRDRRPNGRWRWGFLDLDRALLSGHEADNRVADMAANMGVFRELLNNQEFRQTFAQRYAAHLNSTFNPDRVVAIIDREAARLRSEMPYHVALYGSQGGIASTSAWESEVNVIRNFVRVRGPYVLQHLAALLGASGTAAMTTTASGSGQILANDVPLDEGATNTFVAGVPVRFTAKPNVGQRFAYWLVTLSQPVETVTNIASGSTWRYYDLGAEPVASGGLTWRDSGYPDDAWSSGPAVLGFAGSATVNAVATTTRRYVNGVSGTQVTTTYFRRTFTLDSTNGFDVLTANILRDDGAVVYLNGTEILRENMPAGTPTYGTWSSTAIGSPDQNTVYTRSVSVGALLRAGTNTVAVEVYQGNATSTDLYFDLQTSMARTAKTTSTNASPVLTVTPSSATGLAVRAVFTSTGESVLPSVVSGHLALTAAGSPWLATGDVYVPSNACLTAGPGVAIRMPAAASIYVQGELRLEGSAEAPVRLELNTNDNAVAQVYSNPELNTETNASYWGCIAFDHADHPGSLSNVVIRGASFAAAEPVKTIAAVSSLGTDLFLYGLDVDDSQLPVIAWDSDWFVLRNSRLHITVIGDALKVTRVKHTRIEACDMFCDRDIIDTDAIDLGGMAGDCIVRNCYFHDFWGPNNDGLDLGEASEGILVESNLIERCCDKGISVGSCSSVTVRHNVIRNVDMGLGVKDKESFALVENNTFFNLSHAVSAYEKVIGRGGASAAVRNCIVSQASVSPFYADELSTIDATHTLSDTDPVSGEGNVVGDPLFLNPDADNLALQTGSPAIDSGSPDSAADPDGSRADLGAIPFDWREGHAVISEIFYHPVIAGQAEYVELTNPGGAPLDLTGYSFGKGFTYAFPAGTTLNPNAYLVVASSVYTPNDAPALIWTSGSLDNAGETIQLLDVASNEIDRVAYKPTAPWPVEADGGGSSLALIHPRWNNALPSSWCASEQPGGTPGGAETTLNDTPVWWLAQWGISNQFAEAAAGDWDRDGAPNWAEFVAGTQPTNAASVLRMELWPVGDGRFEIGCETLPTGSDYGGRQRYYTLESRTNLLNGAWSAVEGFSNVLGAGQPLVYTNRPTATEFLRVRAELR